MSGRVFFVGETVRLLAVISGEETPDTVECRIRAPDGTIYQPAVTLRPDGRYQVLINVHQPGTWIYQFRASRGTSTSYAEDTFAVRNRMIT